MGGSLRRALIVVAKEPAPGKTKTRLSPPLSPQEAMDLYGCFLQDTLALMARVETDGVERVIAYAPAGAQAYFRGIAPNGFVLVPQDGKDLAERLDNVLTFHLKNGYGQAVVMNSDGPTLPVECVTHAFELLNEPCVDVVLGPSEDGGYYLIGLKRPCSALFDVAMSTTSVLQETLGRASQQGLRVACLRHWYDVDTPQDLQRLRAELDTLPEGTAPRTREFLVRAAFLGHR
jgi:rSAM/selenodomain-associated transferase 1